MTKQNYILIALFVAVLILALALGCSFMINANAKANADYQDILDDSNSIVNFNQYILNSYIYNFSIAQGTDYDVSNSILRINHVYYIDVLFVRNSGGIAFECKPSGSNTAFNTFSGVQSGNNYHILTLYSQSSVDNWRLTLYSNVSGNSIVYAKAIDLTQMFGAGNEPNLQQCQDLFVAEYYAYSTSSPVSISGLNAFSSGYNQALGDLDVVYNSSIVGSSVYTTNPQYPVDNAALTFFTTAEEIVYYINFDNTYFKNDVFNIHLNMLKTFRTANYADDSIEFGSYSNGQFNTFYSIPLSSPDSYTSYTDMGGNTFYECTYNNVNATFTLPQDINVLYFRTLTDVSTTTFYGMSLKIHSFNIYTAIQNAYNNGYDKANSVYAQQLNSYTDVNGAGYQRIYNTGYEAGQNASVSAARKKTYTFTAFLGALFDVPVNTIKSLLDFNFLGFNLKNFVFSLLTLSIVFALIKFILVKSGGDK